MKDGEAALTGVVAEVEVEIGEPGARHQALVDDGPARQRREVHAHGIFGCPPFDPAARQIQAMLPLVPIDVRPGDQPMPDVWHRRAGTFPKAVGVDGHRPPVDEREAGRFDAFGNDPARPLIPIEQHGHRELAAEEAVRNLDQQTSAVAALAVRVEAAPVGQPRQRLNSEFHRFMTETGGGDEAHAAGGPAGGHMPRPGAACGNKAGGHSTAGYRESPGRASALLTNELAKRYVVLTYPEEPGPAKRRPG